MVQPNVYQKQYDITLLGLAAAIKGYNNQINNNTTAFTFEKGHDIKKPIYEIKAIIMLPWCAIIFRLL